ncbi:DUF4367 domain-containing protein [uncultured Eubacterium sp.]|uniref:DUF4367 domain-containing protein n=1 Tax=uncultured Eubacterium sp. TaxID=165185 RepID=UPI0025D88595|nr:DUF4367 domain-containing protein [uncultured Eubacterium sp.]
MKRKLSKKKLKKMIDSDFTDLSTEEIKALIQKEVDKGPDKLDTDYIDLCFELLSIKNNNTNAKKVKFTKSAKVLLIAATLMVVFISTITVSAQFNLNIPEKIVQLINGNAEIDYNLENADITADGYALLDSDLAKQLADYGITPVTFPEKMIKENSKITKIKLDMNEDVLKIVDIDFEYNGQKGSLYIQQISENTGSTGVNTVLDIKSGRMINVNGMDVLVFEQENSCSIRYKDNFTIYDIHLDCNLETAIKFAESIK